MLYHYQGIHILEMIHLLSADCSHHCLHKCLLHLPINGFIKFNPHFHKQLTTTVYVTQCHDFVMKCSATNAVAQLLKALRYKLEGSGFDCGHK